MTNGKIALPFDTNVGASYCVGVEPGFSVGECRLVLCVPPLFILFARPRPITLAVGAPVSFIGLLLRAWGSGPPQKE